MQCDIITALFSIIFFCNVMILCLLKYWLILIQNRDGRTVEFWFQSLFSQIKVLFLLILFSFRICKLCSYFCSCASQFLKCYPRFLFSFAIWFLILCSRSCKFLLFNLTLPRPQFLKIWLKVANRWKKF